MLTPNSIPVSPPRAARAETEGRRAPPPQRVRGPSSSISLRSFFSFTTKPRTPPSPPLRALPPSPPRAPARPAPQPLELGQRAGAREQLGRAAGPDRRQPRQRVVG